MNLSLELDRTPEQQRQAAILAIMAVTNDWMSLEDLTKNHGLRVHFSSAVVDVAAIESDLDQLTFLALIERRVTLFRLRNDVRYTLIALGCVALQTLAMRDIKAAA